MRGRKFQSQNFWTEFRNFQAYFRTVRAEFLDCFRTVQVEISRLYSNSPDIIFRNVFLVFFYSMESPLILESGHMPVNGIWGPHIF